MTNINPQQLYQFVQQKVGTSLDKREAKELGIQDEYNEALVDADIDVDEIEIDDILEDKDLYAQFATLYVEEKEKAQEAKDKETEKEEQTRVTDKNETGV